MTREGLHLEAGGGLRLAEEASGLLRVAFGEADWLGPLDLALTDGEGVREAGARRVAGCFEGEDDLGRYVGAELAWESLALPVAASVRAYTARPLLVFRLEARADAERLASGRLDVPSVAWPRLRPDRRLAGGVPEGTRGFGHQYTEFAFPTFSDASLADFFLFPNRPAVLMPLWLHAPDGRCLMLAPLDAFHDQVIAVPRGATEAAEGVRCGWHGDLEGVPAGFATELSLWAGEGPRRVLAAWADALRRRHGTQRPSRYADVTVGRLSYWTDNGGAYWYRTEPGMDVAKTLEAVAAGLARDDVPVAAWELDSWFYPHEVSRDVNPEGQQRVPPTGMLVWEERDDVLPEGIPDLRRRLGDAPLIAHSRHFSSRSSYFERVPAWIDADRAHPRDPAFFERLLEQAQQWGVVTFEQDWLVEMFLGVRGLRERPGRARAWQEAMDRAAAERGVSLLWCMGTPADFFQTLSLRQVVAIRTSGDYRYLDDNAANWVRYLLTNALARALGLLPFKDVFLSDRSGTGKDGDPLAEPEALLAALSAGPVGIGDRVGRTDRALVLRTCREDGVLVKPDVPLAAIERCFRGDPRFEPIPLVAETYSRHPAGRFAYVASFNAWRERRPLHVDLCLRELGESAPDAPVLAYDWRTGDFERLDPDARLAFTLGPSDWDFRVLCPLLAGELALFGDVSRYASVGDRRVRGIRATADGVECDVQGRAGERVTLSGWSASPPRAEQWSPLGGAQPLEIERDSRGVFRLGAVVPAAGWLGVRVHRGRP